MNPSTDVRAVVLRAEDEIFSGGADVAIFAGLDEAAAEALMTRALSLIGTIEALPVPTVALVHGRCFAGALEVALACDLIWAAEGTQIGQLEAIVGAFPFAGGTQRLASRIGAARAAEMVFGAGRYSAEELAAWGLITRVTPADRRVDEGRAFASRLATGPDARAHNDQANSPRLALGRGVRSRSGHPDRGSARDPQPGSTGRRGEPAARRPRPRHIRQPLRGTAESPDRQWHSLGRGREGRRRLPACLGAVTACDLRCVDHTTVNAPMGVCAKSRSRQRNAVSAVGDR